MAVSDVECLHSKARKGTAHWLNELRGRLQGTDEVQVCEAARMFVYYARQMCLTASVLARCSGATHPECSQVLHDGENALNQAVDFARDPDRKARIVQRLNMLGDLKGFRVH